MPDSQAREDTETFIKEYGGAPKLPGTATIKAETAEHAVASCLPLTAVSTGGLRAARRRSRAECRDLLLPDPPFRPVAYRSLPGGHPLARRTPPNGVGIGAQRGPATATRTMQDKLNNLSLAKKLSLLAGVLIACLAIVGLVSIKNLSSVNADRRLACTRTASCRSTT